MATKSGSRRWLKEHFTDSYVKQAQLAGYRSRAVYKLLELHERYRLFKPGMTVVDLGAAPGGWSQLLAKLVKPTGSITAIDILPIAPIEGVTIIEGDFSDQAVVELLLAQVSNQCVNWVISDMAPNMSGNESVDIPRAMHLSELALDFALKVLPKESKESKESGFLIKVFQGEGFDAFLMELRKNFVSVAIRKPKASRDRSREVYILAKGRK